jgi:hypothetical protein
MFNTVGWVHRLFKKGIFYSAGANHLIHHFIDSAQDAIFPFTLLSNTLKDDLLLYLRADIPPALPLPGYDK